MWAFSGCGAQAQYLWLEGSRVRDRELWCGGLVDPWRVESSWTGDRTCVPCIGRQIIICCSTSEVLGRSLKIHHQANSCGYWQVPSSLLSIRWSHSFHPCEPLRRRTHSMGTWFCQSEGWERDEYHHLSGRSWFGQWHFLTYSMLYVRSESAGPVHIGDKRIPQGCEEQEPWAPF